MGNRGEAVELPPSVNVSLSPECETLVQRLVATADSRGRIGTWTTVIHDALWQMRTRSKSPDELRGELEQAILDGVNSGPGIPVTEEFWKEMRTRVRRQHEEIAAARARGLVGNLLLPKELLDFINDEITSGRFACPTDVVSEALRTMQEQADEVQ